MTVRLQTTEGRIKKYPTIEPVYSTIGGENTPFTPPEKYVANCGREWKIKPKDHEECDHLDCAIYLAKKSCDNGPTGFMMCIAFGLAMILFGLWKDIDFNIILGGMNFPIWRIFIASSFLMAFLCLIDGFRAGKQFDELNEYKHKNTINGIRAWRIYEDP
jgi:hypothetical protein